jgi:hypothetical protein
MAHSDKTRFERLTGTYVPWLAFVISFLALAISFLSYRLSFQQSPVSGYMAPKLIYGQSGLVVSEAKTNDWHAVAHAIVRNVGKSTAKDVDIVIDSLPGGTRDTHIVIPNFTPKFRRDSTNQMHIGVDRIQPDQWVNIEFKWIPVLQTERLCPRIAQISFESGLGVMDEELNSWSKAKFTDIRVEQGGEKVLLRYVGSRELQNTFPQDEYMLFPGMN